MKVKKFFLIICLIVSCNSLYAITAKDIIAYPVPFNPNKQPLTIGVDSSPSPPDLSGYLLNVSIYDINGDLIIKKTASALGQNIKWNGRNKSGRIVKPGLYILKVEAEKDSTGEYAKKIIRILIDY